MSIAAAPHLLFLVLPPLPPLQEEETEISQIVLNRTKYSTGLSPPYFPATLIKVTETYIKAIMLLAAKLYRNVIPPDCTTCRYIIGMGYRKTK
jgi:hypothetical protein